MSVYMKPTGSIKGLTNSVYFHLNGCLPFYSHTIQKVKPDIIHAHFGYDGYRMIKPAIRSNTPFITGFYGSDVARLPTEFDWKRRYRKLAQYGNAFVAASHRMKKQLIELGFPERKIVIIPYGLDLSLFSFDNSNTQNGSLMMVGRMVEKKGFRYALEAMKLISDNHKNVHLDLYGEGPLENHLKKLVQQWGLDDRVTFHGCVSVQRIIDEHENHSILLAPSVKASDGDEEGLPNTILEAMARGTLVVATNHSAICEVVNHNNTGKVVPERDAEAIADTVKNVLSNGSHTAGIKRKARAVIQKDFEITKVIDQIENLYTKVIDEHSK